MSRFNLNLVLTLILVDIVFLSINSCNSSSLDKELTLTYQEKKILDKFKEEVDKVLPHEYMKKDIYLIKWLREKNFNIPDAKQLLENNLEWRKQVKIDEINLIDWSYYEKEYPFYLDGRDYGGRPVGSADISVWDPRPVVLAGNGDTLLRFIYRTVENAAKLVREDQENGKNVTQFSLVANLNGFNLMQHGCLRCIPIYIRFLLAYQNYFPGMVHKLFIVNTPAAFDVLLRIVWPVLSQELKDSLVIHGMNKREWKRAVLKVIPSEEIRPQFGGTKPRDDDSDFTF